jgi:hypothetical protein
MSKRTVSAAALAVAAGIGLTIWQFDIQPEGASDRGEALLMGDQIVARIDGRTVRENEVMYAIDTPLDVVREKGCKDQVTLTDDKYPLTDNILALEVDGEPVCVAEHETVAVGDLRIKAEALIEHREAQGEALSYPNGVAIDFRRISYWVEPNWVDKLQITCGGVLSGLGAGVLGTWFWERRRRPTL